MTETLLDRALRLHGLGLSLIPLKPRSKEPDASVLPEGWKRYQSERAPACLIRQWFGDGSDRNVGIVLGDVSGGLCAADTDSPEASAWCEARLTPTPMATRSAKGFHLYYRKPTGRDASFEIPAEIRPGGVRIEIKRDGQYLVAPGSVHPSGHVYAEAAQWPETLDGVPELPAATIWAAGEEAGREKGRPEPLPEEIGDGGRNAALFREGCRLRRLGWGEPEIAAGLAAVNQNRCRPPLDPREVETIARSCMKYEPAADSGGDGGDSERKAVFEPASGFKLEAVRWFWQDRLPLGALSLLAGREGIGKTTVAYDLAAQVTRGRLPGKCRGAPRKVIVAATEDSWGHTIRPRLMAAGADLARVGRVRMASRKIGHTELSLPDDLAELERLVRQEGAALVLLDPMISRLSRKIDTHKDAEVRTALEPLAALADATGACVLGIIHVNKGSSRDPLNAVMGSRAFVATARAVLFVAQDPSDEKVRLLGQAKNNLGRTDLPTLTFRIENTLLDERTEEGEEVWTGRVAWGKDSARSIREVVAEAADGGDRSDLTEAAAWLRDYMKSRPAGWDFSKNVKKEARQAGFSEPTLKRAKARLGLVDRPFGFPRRTVWALPGAEVPEQLSMEERF